MMVNFMMQNYLYGRYRWPWISDLYEYVQTIYLLPAVLSVIANPSKPTFKVTAKNEDHGAEPCPELGALLHHLRHPRPRRRRHRGEGLGRALQGRRDPRDRSLEPAQPHHRGLRAGRRVGAGHGRQSHRVRVDRPCRFVMGDKIVDADPEGRIGGRRQASRAQPSACRVSRGAPWARSNSSPSPIFPSSSCRWRSARSAWTTRACCSAAAS